MASPGPLGGPGAAAGGDDSGWGAGAVIAGEVAPAGLAATASDSLLRMAIIWACCEASISSALPLLSAALGVAM